MNPVCLSPNPLHSAEIEKKNTTQRNTCNNRSKFQYMAPPTKWHQICTFAQNQ